MTSIAWVAALVVVGLVAIVLEVFVPSGGVLGLVSVVSLVAGVATAFIEEGVVFGMAALAITAVAAPMALATALRLFPFTPLGRRVMPPPPQPDDVVPDIARRRSIALLVGRGGNAVGDLLPWGIVRIDGVEYEAMSDSGPIASDAAVDVVGVQATALVVRGTAGTPEPRRGPQVQRADSSSLEASLESFDFDSLGTDGTTGTTPPC